MAQEVDDAIGQLVRQRRWIQEARVEVCTSPVDSKGGWDGFEAVSSWIWEPL